MFGIYGISTFVGELMPNHIYRNIHLLNIYGLHTVRIVSSITFSYNHIYFISSRLRLGITWSVSLSILPIPQDLFRDLVDAWSLNCLLIICSDYVLDVDGPQSNLAEDSLNVLPGLSLFTLVFKYIFPGWPMWACGFCLSGSGFFGDKFLSLSLTVFDWRTGDQCEHFFFVNLFFIFRRSGLCLSGRFCVYFSFDYFIGFLFDCCNFFFVKFVLLFVFVFVFIISIKQRTY